MELARIADHLVCNSVIGVDTGALTGFTYVFQYREKIYEIFEEICGSRLTTNIGRFGGFERNFTQAAWDKLDNFMATFPDAYKEFEDLLNRNRIFMERCMGAGPITAEIINALGCFYPYKLFNRKMPADIINRCRAIIQTIRKRCDLIIRTTLCNFFESTVNVAHCRLGAQHTLTIHFKNILKYAMRGGVRGTEV